MQTGSGRRLGRLAVFATCDPTDQSPKSLSTEESKTARFIPFSNTEATAAGWIVIGLTELSSFRRPSLHRNGVNRDSLAASPAGIPRPLHSYVLHGSAEERVYLREGIRFSLRFTQSMFKV